jgi:hypothetical protein
MTRLFWRLFFPFLYVVLRVADPLLARWTAGRGLGNTVELYVRGQRTGIVRSVLVGLVSVGGTRYLGHANTSARWTHNLAAAGRGELRVDGGPPIPFVAVPVPPGPERDSVVSAAGRQHPFPADLAYRVAARQIRAEGTFFRLEPAGGAVIPLPSGAERRAGGPA